MKFLRSVFLLLLISALLLESDAWWRRRRRRSAPTGCSSPPTLAYTYRSGCYSPYTNGERCTYRCRPGYSRVSGDYTRTCSGGRWVGTNLVCRRVSTCSSPPTLAYTYRSGCYSPYTNGERCTYRCRPGYTRVSGGYTKTCSGGRWYGTNLVCRSGSTCSSPPTLPYTYRSGCYHPYTQGERCTYRCRSGYTQVSGSTTRTCNYGTWAGTNLVCRRGGGVCPIPSGPGICVNRCYGDNNCRFGQKCCSNGCGRVCMSPTYG